MHDPTKSGHKPFVSNSKKRKHSEISEINYSDIYYYLSCVKLELPLAQREPEPQLEPIDKLRKWSRLELNIGDVGIVAGDAVVERVISSIEEGYKEEGGLYLKAVLR